MRVFVTDHLSQLLNRPVRSRMRRHIHVLQATRPVNYYHVVFTLPAPSVRLLITTRPRSTGWCSMPPPRRSAPSPPIPSNSARRLQSTDSLSDPDGLACDAEGGEAVCHSSFSCVWLFSKLGEPLYRAKSCQGIRMTNCARSAGPT